MAGPCSCASTDCAAARPGLVQFPCAGGGGPPYQTTDSLTGPGDVTSPVETMSKPFARRRLAIEAAWFAAPVPFSTVIFRLDGDCNAAPVKDLSPALTSKI